MSALFPKISLLGGLFLFPLLAWAGGMEWALLRPPGLSYDLPSLASGSPSLDDDDSGGSLTVSENSDEGFFSWMHAALSLLFGGGDAESEISDDDYVLRIPSGVEDDVDESRASNPRFLRLLPAFRTDLRQEDLPGALVRYLWLALDWQEIQRVDNLYVADVGHVYPYLRLYDYEPRRPVWVDPEFVYALIEGNQAITIALNMGERTLYLEERARWMDLFMEPEDRLQAWGELALHYASSREMQLIFKRILTTPWQEPVWRLLGASIGSIDNERLRLTVTRLVYARFLLLHTHFRFSACMPWLLVLPGLSEEERVAVQNYLTVFIQEKEANENAIIDRVHAVFLDLLLEGQHSEMLQPFIHKLFDEGVYEGSARGLLFLLRSFCLLDEGEAVEVCLFNKIALLLLDSSDNPIERGLCIFKGISDLLREKLLSIKAHKLCLELLCTPLVGFPRIENQRIVALGYILSDSNVECVTFQRLWKVFCPLLEEECLSTVAGVLQALPSIICSPHLSSTNRRASFRRLIEERDYDGAFVIDLLLNPNAPENLVDESLNFLVQAIECQPSDAFWNAIKAKLSHLLSLLYSQEGRFQGYYNRIIDSLNSMVGLPQDRLSKYPFLMDLRREAIEILLKHYLEFYDTAQLAIDLLVEASSNMDAPAHMARLWRRLFVENNLNDKQLELCIEFLLSQESALLRSALAVPLSRVTLESGLRARILKCTYDMLDARSAVTLLLKGVSWVQEAKILYGLEKTIRHCDNQDVLNQVRVALIYSGFFRCRLQQAFTVRRCDAVALRFLHAAKGLLETLGRPDLMDAYLETRMQALIAIANQQDLYPEFAKASSTLLRRMSRLGLIALEEGDLPQQ